MTPVFPSTALRSNQANVKQAAKHGPVLITDNNGQQYVFCSEEALEDVLRKEAKEAAYAARMAWGIRRAKEGIEQGAYVVGAEAAIELAQRWAQRG